MRFERGVSYHGIALNVTTRLDDFGLIDPCGMPDVAVTSIAAEAAWPDPSPTTASVHEAAERFASAFSSALTARDVTPRAAPAPALTGS
jgi:lipoate-protein ligase B